MNNVLKIGMPSGSLADPNRGGNLIKLLENAGFKTSGYDAGGPSKFITSQYLFGWDGRPQEFSSQLGINEIDVAIAGEDWVQERMLEFNLEYNQKIELEKVLQLNRGGVKIVGIIDNCYETNTAEDFLKQLTSQKDCITIVSEMPYLSLNWLQGKLKTIGLFDKYSTFSVQKYKTPAKIKKGVLVYETWGKTESKVKNGGADLGVEITQSGSAIRNYALKIIDTVMQSQTAIFINPQIKKDPEKNELLNMFLLNIYGAINAENKMMIIFNVPHNAIEKVEKYLSDNKLYADEPTISVGKNFNVYTIQIDMMNSKIPVAKVRYDLSMLEAKNINTVPIQSCIPGIESITK